jgi:hypothetical protein
MISQRASTDIAAPGCGSEHAAEVQRGKLEYYSKLVHQTVDCLEYYAKPVHQEIDRSPVKADA